MEKCINHLQVKGNIFDRNEEKWTIYIHQDDKQVIELFEYKGSNLFYYVIIFPIFPLYSWLIVWSIKQQKMWENAHHNFLELEVMMINVSDQQIKTKRYSI